ncbi:MAG TPA: cation diffusion facilitator family transporter [Hyphomicrobiales bacterium]|nr:cation diffusion facilitator family transporter [Hyphomicrobiales bacterium]
MADHHHHHPDGEHHHGHGDEDRHAHAHGHSHAPDRFGSAFALGTALNLAFVVAEAALGVVSGSIALIADAGHNLGDVLGLFGAWGAHAAGRWQPTERFTYGYGRASILAALGNAIVLLVTVGGIAWEAIIRLVHPSPVASLVMIAVAAVGIVVNGATALLFAAGRKGDLNIRSAFVHMAADAALSAAVAVAGLVILATGWQWVDPAASLVVCGVIVWSTWGLLRESVTMSMDAVPRGIDMNEVRRALEVLPGVSDVHDLHVWSLSTRQTALTCHLLMPAGHPGDGFILSVCRAMQVRFGIAHTTVQIETDEATVCEMPHSHVA